MGVLLMFVDSGGNFDRTVLHPCTSQANENNAECKLLFYVSLGGQPMEWNGLKLALIVLLL